MTYMSSGNSCKASIPESVTDPMFYSVMPYLGIARHDDVRQGEIDKRRHVDFYVRLDPPVFGGWQTLAMRARSGCTRKYGDVCQTSRNRNGCGEPEITASRANLLLYGWVACKCTGGPQQVTEAYLLNLDLMRQAGPCRSGLPQSNGQQFAVWKLRRLWREGCIISSFFAGQSSQPSTERIGA